MSWFFNNNKQRERDLALRAQLEKGSMPLSYNEHPRNEADNVIVLEKEPVKQKTSNEIIQEIHDSYDNAHMDLLAFAKKTLAECETEDILKGERLSKLGFLNSAKAKAAAHVLEQRQEAQKKASLIEYYQQKYPFQKFINIEQVQAINKKYGLTCVTADCYLMNIPEKNLSEIENFKFDDVDAVYAITVENDKGSFTEHFQASRKLVNERWYKETKEKEPFYISCPPHEAKIKNGYHMGENGFMQKTAIVNPVNDPIVLQPVKGGFLIVTKWGLEASDPMLTNEIMN